MFPNGEWLNASSRTGSASGCTSCISSMAAKSAGMFLRAPSLPKPRSSSRWTHWRRGYVLRLKTACSDNLLMHSECLACDEKPMNWKLLSIATFFIAVLFAACSLSLYVESSALRSQLSNASIRDSTPRVGIVIALSEEARPLLNLLTLERNVVENGFNFSLGTMAAEPVVVVVGGMGEEAAAAVTMAMHTLFNLKWAVNIGTSGSHSRSLDVGDVIVARRIVGVGARMVHNLTHWSPEKIGMTLPNGTQIRFLHLNTTESLVALAEQASTRVQLPPVPTELTGTGTQRRPSIVLNGTIASSNIWNANASVIQAIRSALGTDVEEMEAYGFGLTCYRLHIPFIKIAVVSDSEFSGSVFGPKSIKVSMTNGAVLLAKMIELSNPSAHLGEPASQSGSGPQFTWTSGVIGRVLCRGQRTQAVV